MTKLLFMGRKQAGAACLQWCVQNGFEVIGVLTDSHLAASPITEKARELGLPVLDYDKVPALIASGALQYDVAVSYLYWRILRDPLLGHPKRGVINFHPAPLPEFKGTAGYNMAILEARDDWGVTAHYVDEGVDTGPIIEVFRFSIDSEAETAQSLEEMSQTFLMRLFRKTMRRVLSSEEKLTAVPNGPGRYISRQQMESEKRIKPGDDLDRKIRAFWFPPYSGATITLEGRDYTLVNEDILRRLAPPGTTSLFTGKVKSSKGTG